jgi:hypothetical protein
MDEGRMFIQPEVRESGIFGKGLFAAQAVRKGTIICCFTLGSRVITERQFIAACEADDKFIMRTGTRYVGKYFTVGNESAPYTFINHSFDPNVLAHCGILLARRDIELQEELTVDYRTLVDPTDVATYDDAATGERIRGLPAKDTLLKTARELIALVEGVSGWEG